MGLMRISDPVSSSVFTVCESGCTGGNKSRSEVFQEKKVQIHIPKQAGRSVYTHTPVPCVILYLLMQTCPPSSAWDGSLPTPSSEPGIHRWGAVISSPAPVTSSSQGKELTFYTGSAQVAGVTGQGASQCTV